MKNVVWEWNCTLLINKSKLNTNSSAEGELVVTSEYFLFNVWVVMFMGAQGYTVKEKMIFKDNQSAIRMEVNVRNSYADNLRKIRLRYLFVKYRVGKH